MKIWKMALVSVLAIGLVLGIASPALAAPPWASSPVADPPPPKILKGEVVTKDESSFTIRSGWWETTVSVSGDTEYFKTSLLPRALLLMQHQLQQAEPDSGRGWGLRERLHLQVKKVLSALRAPALVRNRLELRERVCEELGEAGWLCPFVEPTTFEDVEVGNRVVAWVVTDDGDPLAKRVLIIEPTACHRILATIISIDPEAKTLTAAVEDGSEVVLNYDSDTIFILRGTTGLGAGDKVRVVYDGGDMAKVVSMTEVGAN